MFARALLAIGLTVCLIAPTVASAQQASPTARRISDACEGAPPAGFSDTASNVHKPQIDCLAWREVTAGRPDGSYGAKLTLSRGQVARFFVNVLVARGFELPPPSADYFTDDNGTAHEDAINQLVEIDVLADTGDSYEPGGPATRSFMALVTAKATRFAGVADPTAIPDYYTDDNGDPNEQEINLISAHGIVTGKGGGIYAPNDVLPRDQMATFLARMLALVVESGGFTPITVSGDTDDVVTMRVPLDGLAILEQTYTGDDIFTVEGLDEDGETVDFYGSSFGDPYNGRSPVNFSSFRNPVRRIEVDAQGPWTITLRPMTQAATFDGSLYEGDRDVVLNARAVAGQTVEATYTGDGVFTVTAYDRDGDTTEFPFSSFGESYEGASFIPSDTVWFEVVADDTFTLKVRPE